MSKTKNHNKHLINVNVNSPLSTRSGKIRNNLNKSNDSLPELDFQIKKDLHKSFSLDSIADHVTHFQDNLSSTIIENGLDKTIMINDVHEEMKSPQLACAKNDDRVEDDIGKDEEESINFENILLNCNFDTTDPYPDPFV